MNENLANALAELAAQLGTTVPYLWDVMIHGVMYRALADVVGWTLFFLLCAFAAKRAHVLSQTAKYDELGFLVWVCAIPAIFALLGALASTTDLVVALASPEYAALEKIMRAAR